MVWREPRVGRQEDPRLPVPASCVDRHSHLGCFWSQETLLFCACGHVCSVTSESVIAWTVARQAPLPMEHAPGKNTGVSWHFLLQGIFRTHGPKVSYISCIIRQVLHLWHRLGSPL